MIIRTAVGRPVAVLMLFAGLVLIGVLALRRLPVDLLPAINYPNLTVITNYTDTPADDLARLVTQPLEEVVTGLAGVRRVTSKTREGVSTITVQYEWGTGMDFANLHLREAIDGVQVAQVSIHANISANLNGFLNNLQPRESIRSLVSWFSTAPVIMALLPKGTLQPRAC